MDKLCVSKLCVDKLCVSCVWTSRAWTSCVRRRRKEEAEARGSAQPKTRTPHKDVGKTYIQIKTYNDLYIYIYTISKKIWIWDNGGVNQQNYGDHWGVKSFFMFFF